MVQVRVWLTHPYMSNLDELHVASCCEFWSLFVCIVIIICILVFHKYCLAKTTTCVLHANIDQTLTNSLHGLLSFDIGGFVRSVITTEYL